MDELSFASATELAARIRSRDLSPTELMRHTLDRIARVNGELNAVIQLDEERAVTEAAAATERIARGEDPGPLAGLPLLVKDLEDAAGFPTTKGTKAFRQAAPAGTDSIHVARLRAAGAIVIGKTNTPPLGAAIHTDNDAFGLSRNPWDPTRSPGGSSGGSAAAVAAGLAPLATAGDGGGSTRIPAALCGIPGLKPTRGRIPQGPTAKADWTHHACPSPMTRTVRDAALHLDIAAGYHRADPFSLPDPARPFSTALDDPLPRLRIAVNRTLGVANPEPAVLHALDRAVDVLRDLGHRITDDHTAHPDADDLVTSLQLRQLVLAHNRFLGLRDELATRPDDFEPWFATLLRQGSTLTADDLGRYWAYRARLDTWAADLFGRYDLLLTPTTPTTAWPAEGPDVITAVLERTIPVTFTAPFNDTGHPAISIPTGTSPQGLPCAVQLVAAHHRDDLLLTVAATMEQALGRIHPPVR